MSAPGETDSRETAAIPVQRLLRWAAVAGVIVAPPGLIQILWFLWHRGTLADGWLEFSSWLRLLNLIQVGVGGAAMCLLLIGSIALLLRRPLARPLLLIYTGLWLGSQLLGILWSAGYLLDQTVYGGWSQGMLIVIGSTSAAIYHSLLAIFFILLLARSRSTELPRRHRPGGFEPVLRDPREVCGSKSGS